MSAPPLGGTVKKWRSWLGKVGADEVMRSRVYRPTGACCCGQARSVRESGRGVSFPVGRGHVAGRVPSRRRGAGCKRKAERAFGARVGKISGPSLGRGTGGLFTGPPEGLLGEAEAQNAAGVRVAERRGRGPGVGGGRLAYGPCGRGAGRRWRRRGDHSGPRRRVEWRGRLDSAGRGGSALGQDVVIGRV